MITSPIIFAGLNYATRKSITNKIDRSKKKVEVSQEINQHFDIICEKIKELYGVSKEQILSKSRRAEYVFPRQLISFILWEKYERHYSIDAIIGTLINRDRATARHGHKVITNLLTYCKKTQAEINKFENLNSWKN